MTSAAELIAKEVGALNETLGGVMSMAGDEPTYIPLEEFMSAEAIKAGPGDFDMSDLVFDHEL